MIRQGNCLSPGVGGAAQVQALVLGEKERDGGRPQICPMVINFSLFCFWKMVYASLRYLGICVVFNLHCQFGMVLELLLWGSFQKGWTGEKDPLGDGLWNHSMGCGAGKKELVAHVLYPRDYKMETSLKREQVELPTFGDWTLRLWAKINEPRSLIAFVKYVTTTAKKKVQSVYLPLEGWNMFGR